MTGYGKAVVAYKEKKINVEVKSLNSKALDLSTRIAPLYREKEMELRQIIAKEVIRGKVDFAIWIEKDAGADATPINEALIDNYYHQIKDIMAHKQLPEPSDWWATLLRLPDVTTRTDVEKLTDEEWECALEAVRKALKEFHDFRCQEGAALQKKFAEKIDNIEALLAQIEPYEKERVEKIRARIVDGLKSIPDVEYDSKEFHGEEDQHASDTNRAAALQEMGIEVIMVAKKQFEDQELYEQLVQKIRASLGMRRDPEDPEVLFRRAQLRKYLMTPKWERPPELPF